MTLGLRAQVRVHASHPSTIYIAVKIEAGAAEEWRTRQIIRGMEDVSRERKTVISHTAYAQPYQPPRTGSRPFRKPSATLTPPSQRGIHAEHAFCGAWSQDVVRDVPIDCASTV